LTGDVLVLAEAAGDSFIDPTFELIGKARQLAGTWGGRVVALILGPSPEPSLLDADLVLTMDHPNLTSYSPEAHLAALHAVVAGHEPKLVLLANTTRGMDLGAGLSVRWGRPLAAYAVGVTAEIDAIVVTSQLFGGHLLAEVVVDGGQGVCTVVAGSFPVRSGEGGAGAPEMHAVAPPATLDSVATRTRQVPAGEDDDIDITKAAVLVSIGRGLKSEDNVAAARDFADAIGASLSGTSQVCDLGWLPRTRHVGKSGVKVRPRAYLTFGISGAPEHLEGIGDSELIIACNTDPAAPIFNVAHYGTTLDALELLRALRARAGA
jgi:electron transfer flavoprotein alpha subunit